MNNSLRAGIDRPVLKFATQTSIVRKAFGCIAAVLVVLSSTAACLAEPFALSLSVQESAGVARRAEPISGGVPMPPGRFRKDQPFALYRADGTQLPCQVTPLVVHTDGTLRWVLLDFQDDVAAASTNRYVLREAKARATAQAGIQVRQGSGQTTVDTGKIRFTVAKDKPFGLFDTVTVGGRRTIVGGKLTCTQLRGRKGWDDPAKWQKCQFTAGVPETIKLWHAGSMRVTLEVTGRFAGDELKMGYQAWITAWAGSSRVHVKLKLRNSNPEQYTAVLVGRAALELRLAEPTRSVQLGAAKAIKTGPGAWLHQGLYLHRTYQDIPGAARAGNGSQELWRGNGPKDAPAGWIAVTGGKTVFVCDRLFATNPARRLAAGASTLTLEPIAQRFQGPKDRKFKENRRIGEPWQSAGYWLYDCSHHSSEYLIDFDAPADADALGRLARATRNRLWALAPGEHYSACEAMGTGRFGTLADETACYRKWGWAFKDRQLPRQAKARPGQFVDWEDNHYESEADSVQGLGLMYLRTGQRGWFDQAEAWARYHMDLQAWRTDGWRWKDGAIWFPQGGPQGNKRVRRQWNFKWGPNWGDRKASAECADLWRQAQAKSCYCHYYGSGLVDWYCLTGDVDALRAAIDNVEQKDSEFRQYRNFTPGKTPVGSIRGFGRGFEVMMRVLQADPDNAFVRDLCTLCARTLWASPLLDERGFHCSRIGQMPAKNLSARTKQWMARNGVKIISRGGNIESLRKGGKTWKVHAMGGTWMHVYIQNGADLYAGIFGNDETGEDMRDFATAFAQFSARYMLSPKCHQTWYYTYLDVPEFGRIYDPWAFDHTSTRDGEGCVHSGYYTRHYVDACTKGYSLTGEEALLARAREFWHYGSKRRYRTKGLNAGRNAVGTFAGHTPPKDDTVLSASRLFYETSHPRRDAKPPAAVADLRVRLLAGGKAEVSFTAPADAGGGKVVRYQVKAAPLPIVPYEQFDYARDFGRKRNWWRAANLTGEPTPAAPGKTERFTVTGLLDAKTLHFAVRSFDDSSNRSAISNSVTVQASGRKVRVRVAVYNVACGQWATPEKVAREMKKHNLDILGLNEMPRLIKGHSGRQWCTRLAKVLEMPYVYSGRISSANHGAPRWVDESGTYEGKYKAILSKTPLVDTREFELTGGNWNPASAVRAVTLVRGVRLSFYSLHVNTHWKDLEKILKEDKEFHVLAGGDYNHSNYPAFDKAANMRDGRWDVKGKKTLDRILYRPNGKVKCVFNDVIRPKVRMSDHPYAVSVFEFGSD